MRMSTLAVSVAILLSATTVALDRKDETPRLVLPDIAKEVPAFTAEPVGWNMDIINAGQGGGGPDQGERKDGFFHDHWIYYDYVDRCADYSTHDYLDHRGIRYERYGSNEYQETIHFYEDGAKKFFWDNGIARDIDDKRVISQYYNRNSGWKSGFDAFIMCNNAPRWSAVLNYDLLPSPLLGYAVSQDNIGGPTTRVGTGSCGRYCDFCNLKFFQYLKTTDRLPEFRREFKHIRDYVNRTKAIRDAFHKLPPYTKWSPDYGPIIAAISDDPVMAEYLKFLYLSHIHNWIRYYRDQKLVANRIGRKYSVHGNQCGGWAALSCYGMILSNFVDTVWLESAGQTFYDIFKGKWMNAWGPHRYELALAFCRGEKPMMSMTKLRDYSLPIFENEIAESCAGGSILFAAQSGLRKYPGCLDILSRYLKFRYDHHGIFSMKGRKRHAQVAMVYSVPTMMYRNFVITPDSPPLNGQAGMSRAFEEGHIPYDIIVFSHPEIYPDEFTLDELKRYRVIVMPGIECVSDHQSEMIEQYLAGGGIVALLDDVGTRDENYRPRKPALVERWKSKGTVVPLLNNATFPMCRRKYESCVGVIDQAIASLKNLLGDDLILRGDIPRRLWIKTWVHFGEYVSVHLVNYQIEYPPAKLTPTAPFDLTIRIPPGVTVEEVRFLTPGREEVELRFERRGNAVKVTVPRIQVYGVLVIGRRGAERMRSLRMAGDHLMSRIKFACSGDPGELRDELDRLKKLGQGATADTAPSYYNGALALMKKTAAMEDQKFFDLQDKMTDPSGAVVAFNFGAREEVPGWRMVLPDTDYAGERGYGWLPVPEGEAFRATPSEEYYSHSAKKESLPVLNMGRLYFWPYTRLQNPVVGTNIWSCRPRTFRIDLPDGVYRVDVVNSNANWNLRDMKISGLVRDNGRFRLCDVPVKLSGAVQRRFFTEVRGGRLDLTFGGTTEWGISLVKVSRTEGTEPDSLAEGAVRTWRISPRFPNKDWWPVRQVRFSPEDNLTEPDTKGWVEMSAPTEGIGVINLGGIADADVGDVVYAVSVVNSDADKDAEIHASSTSAAVIYLNGEEVGYIPNQKGLIRDELVQPVRLRKGRNTIVVKLCRFWERTWMFYVSILPAAR